MSAGISEKATFLVVTGSQSDPSARHLFILVTPPDDRGRCLAVTVSSVSDKYFCDDTCSIDPGEHEFIVRPSFVRYQRTKILTETQLQSMLASGDALARVPVSDSLFARIAAGVLASPFTPQGMKDFFHRATST